MLRPLIAVMVLSLTTEAVGQLLNSGDIGMTTFVTNQFYIRRTNGTINTVYVPFQGANGGWSQAILWDPAKPDSFIIGGNAFLGRATMTGPSTATWTPITNMISEVAQMSWDANGDLVVTDYNNRNFFRVKPACGQVTPITTGVQPWGTSLNGGMLDAATGTLYAGNNTGGIYQRAFGAAAFSILANTSGSIAGIIRDPLGPGIAAACYSNSRIVRVSPTGVVTDLVTPSSIPQPNAISVNAANEYVVARSANADGSGNVSFTLYRIPNAGGAAIVLGSALLSVGAQNAYTTGWTLTGLAVAGTGPQVQRFSITTVAGGDRSFAILGIPSTAFEGWTLVSTTTNLPAGCGGLFGIYPDFLTLQFLLATPTAAPGDPFHWVANVPGFFPSVPFTIPGAVGTALAGQRWDFAAVTINGAGQWTESPVNRYTW